MNYPRIYLVADNCFAIKRWVYPMEWAKIIKDIGIKYIEMSTDNECDPLYNTGSYLENWTKNVKIAEKETATKVVNFFTGYQSYRTIGLAHPDKEVSRRILDNWLKKMIKIANILNSGLGFYIHAIPEKSLQSPDIFNITHEQILKYLSELAIYAWENGEVQISLEQMYSPHQTPWTIKGAKKIIKDIYSRTKKPFYITIDVGHQIGQRKYLKPKFEDIENEIYKFKQEGKIGNLWLGPITAYNIFEKALKANIIDLKNYIKELENEIEKYTYMFAEYEDGDTYKWLESLAAYSPIIHLQQNDGISSWGHAPFTSKNNIKGIIKPDKLLKAIAKSYEKEKEEGMPPRCKDIYLTFEIFASNTDYSHDIIKKMKESVNYWRKFIPEDGLKLNEL
jgi:hypothetical protein